MHGIFLISYKDNINVGSALLAITGINDYTGSVSKNFTIANYDLGDVNDNSKINIIDAQIVFDMSNGEWTETTKYDKLLEKLDNGWDVTTLENFADANENAVVNADDARAIQNYVHNGSFKETA